MTAVAFNAVEFPEGLFAYIDIAEIFCPKAGSLTEAKRTIRQDQVYLAKDIKAYNLLRLDQYCPSRVSPAQVVN